MGKRIVIPGDAIVSPSYGRAAGSRRFDMRCIQVHAVALAILATISTSPSSAGDGAKGFWFWSKPASQSYHGKEIISYASSEAPGTVVVDSPNHRLYFILPGRKAIRYVVGVGREGFGWSGTARIARRAEWPAWVPPRELVERAAKDDHFLPYSIDGGANNPLGARALYLFQGKRDTLVRIHGTNEPASVGKSVSSGCIRMRNEDVIDLYKRVRIGTKVIVRS